MRLSILAAATVPTCRIRLCRPVTDTFIDDLADGAGHTFFRTSRSMRVQSSSRRRRVISAAWSKGKATGLADAAPGEPAARGGGEEPPISAERHCLSMDGWIPSSAAICICGRPLLSKSATASRLNSGVNSRLVLPIKHLRRPQGAYQRCAWNRGRITLAFLAHPDAVEATNNGSERLLRPPVVQQKVTNGYRAMRAAEGEATIRTVVDTARLAGRSLFGTILKSVGT